MGKTITLSSISARSASAAFAICAAHIKSVNSAIEVFGPAMFEEVTIKIRN